jgi:hypothetical protein
LWRVRYHLQGAGFGALQTICPLDGEILDDEINNIIVRPLVHGVRLHAIIDACRSGTVLDLPYLCKINKYSL